MRSGIHEGLRRKRRDEGMRAIVIDQSKSSINGNRGHWIKAEGEKSKLTQLLQVQIHGKERDGRERER